MQRNFQKFGSASLAEPANRSNAAMQAVAKEIIQAQGA
jgi:hypothetical protein